MGRRPPVFRFGHDALLAGHLPDHRIPCLPGRKHAGDERALWAILVLIPMVGVLFLVIYIIVRETGGQKPVPGEKSTMDILKERYAKGEVTSEQFQKMSEDLKK
jgi:hypothetical protein